MLSTAVVVMAVNFYVLMRAFCTYPINKQKEKFNRKVCAKETSAPHFSLKALLSFYQFSSTYRSKNKAKGKMIQNQSNEGR